MSLVYLYCGTAGRDLSDVLFDPDSATWDTSITEFKDTLRGFSTENDSFSEVLITQDSVSKLDCSIMSKVDRSVHSYYHDMSVFNMAHGESKLLVVLCACNIPQ